MLRVRTLAVVAVAALVVGGVGLVPSAWAGQVCGRKGCTFDQPAPPSPPASTPAAPSGPFNPTPYQPNGPTTCTATDYSTNPPHKVTGPITSRPLYYDPTHSNSGPPLFAGPPTPPPASATGPGQWYQIYCALVPLDIEWVQDNVTPPPPTAPSITPAQLAALAQATIPLHAPTIHINPTGDQLVGMATWFWVDPADIGTLPASDSQNGVSVTGSVTADHFTVDPGDGTGTFSCPGSGTPWAPGAQTSCSHTYPRSSAGQKPNDAFTAKVTVTWVGSYTATINGAPAPGGPLGPVVERSSAAIRVAEAQAINTN